MYTDYILELHYVIQNEAIYTHSYRIHAKDPGRRRRVSPLKF